MLVDSRELRKSHSISIEQLIDQINSGVDTSISDRSLSSSQDLPWCEVGNRHLNIKNLPIGDYILVARKVTNPKSIQGSNTSQAPRSKIQEERILAIIERKNAQDLSNSLRTPTKAKGAMYPLTKMETQMYKLRHCCPEYDKLDRVLLIEGSIYKGGFKMSQVDKKRAWGFRKQIEAEQKETNGALRLETTPDLFKTRDFLVSQIVGAIQKDSALFEPAKFPTFQHFVQSAEDVVNDPRLQYYVSLRKIEGIGDVAATSIMKAFPSPLRFKRELDSPDSNIVDRLKEIRSIGGKRRLLSQTCITNLKERFCPPKPRSFASPSRRSTDSNSGDEDQIQWIKTVPPFRSPDLTFPSPPSKKSKSS